MLCPFCLTKIRSDIKSCSSCEHELPPEYVVHHSGWRARFSPPAIVSVIGFVGHGKTVYLASLFYALQNHAPNAWRKFYRQGLTIDTLKVLYKNLALLKSGDLPEATPHVFPVPNIDRLHHVPKFGNRTLLMYDPPGDAFELLEDDSLQKFAGFAKHSPCALFLISLTDMMQQYESEDSVAGEMNRLLERYNLGLMGAKKKQHLIVVYTKADRLLSQVDFPSEVIACLENSGVDGLGNINNYMLEMKKNSLLLRDFTENTMNARSFLNNAQENFKSVEFCAVSSLGSEPSGHRLAERVTPRRVLDPLLWVLSKSPGNGW
jgi:double-GTPase-like protein